MIANINIILNQQMNVLIKKIVKSAHAIDMNYKENVKDINVDLSILAILNLNVLLEGKILVFYVILKDIN